MTRNFKILFFIKFTHDFYKPEMPDPFIVNMEDFRIVPTSECSKIMSKHGLFFKKKGEEYAIVYQENENGEILRQITKPVKFSFLLYFRNQGLKSKTDFDPGIGTYPTLVGRPMYYLNNMNEFGTVYNEDMSPNSEMSISQEGEVSWTDLVAVVPSIFSIKSDSAQNYTVRQLKPGTGFEVVVSDVIPEDQSTYKIDLSQQLDTYYQFVLDGKKNALYKSDEIFRAAPFGLIEIFLPQNPNYAPRKQYFIEFMKK